MSGVMVDIRLGHVKLFCLDYKHAIGLKNRNLNLCNAVICSCFSDLSIYRDMIKSEYVRFTLRK